LSRLPIAKRPTIHHEPAGNVLKTEFCTRASPPEDPRFAPERWPQSDTGGCFDLNVVQIFFADTEVAAGVGRSCDLRTAAHFVAAARYQCVDQTVAQLLKFG
jgi:hypothetical protein